MNNLLKKVCVIGLIGILTLSVAACQKTTENSNPDTATEKTAAAAEPKKQVSLTLLVDKGTNFPEENLIKQELENKSGYKLNFIAVDSKDNALLNRLNLIIASNEWPDIVTVPSQEKLPDLVDNNKIIALDDLLKKVGTNILKDKGDFLKAGPAIINGKIYGLARGFGYPVVTAVRKDWLDKLKLPVPTTTDEFYNVLKAFRDGDPDGNGKKDTIPLGLSLSANSYIQSIFGSFGLAYYPGSVYCQYVDGKTVPAITSPNYLEAMKYFNKLYSDGLIEPEFATIAAMKEYEKLWNGQIGAFDFTPNGTTQNWVSRYTENPKPVFEFPEIKGSSSKAGTVRVKREFAAPWVCVAKASKYQEEAVKFLDFLESEQGDTLTMIGIEGKHFKINNGKFEEIPPYNDVPTARQDGIGAYNFVNMRIDNWDIKRFNDLTKKGIALGNKIGIDFIATAATPKIATEVKTQLGDIEKEAFVTLMTAKGDITAEYEKFKKKWNDAGGKTYSEQLTEIYKKENNIK